MSEIIEQKEVKKVFKEFAKENRIKIDRKRNFGDFLKFLEIDFYDWIKENLRCYFRDRKSKR